MRAISSLLFDRDGAQRFGRAAFDVLPALETLCADLPKDQAGVRLYGIAGLAALLAPSAPIGAVGASILGEDCRPVRAVLFDKSAATNWSLAWHQDRTICVKQRKDVPGFGPWTRKQGLLHVAPPFAIIGAMVTLRVHLDSVGPDNAPLFIAPGSHREGRVPVNHIADVVQRCGTTHCLADAGDIWLYSTPIIHASETARIPHRRRVLQIDYACGDLPGRLEWCGI